MEAIWTAVTRATLSGEVLGPQERVSPYEALLGVTRDVTERQRADAELRIAAAAFESQEGYVVTDARSIIMRINDILLAFPQIVFVLLVVSGFGTSIFLIAITVGMTHAPRTARIIRAAAAEVMERDFIKAAVAVGEKRRRIITSELLPNVTSPLLVEFGLRMTYSIGLVAAVSFLGLGLQPPAADWGLMINENRGSMTVQPWAVLTPIFAIAVFTIGINFITDSFAKVAIGIDRKGKE